jgi:hypothetical protein
MGERAGLVARPGQVVRPGTAAVGPVDAREERRDDLPQLGQQAVGDVAGLGELVRSQAQQQPLVGLPGGEHPDVRRGGRRQQAAQQVERLRLRGVVVDERRGGVILGPALADPVQHLGHQRGVGVEDRVEGGLVRRGVRPGHDVGVAVVAVATVALVVVGDVARRLLEVGREPAPLDPLGQQVRDVLDRDVRAAELGHRVVAVLGEDPVVELLGPRRRVVLAQILGELVEEQLLQALR